MKRLVLMLALAAFACSPLLTTEVSAATVHHVKHHKKHHRKHHKHVKHHAKHKVA